jgi:hypothetical protein
MSAQKMKKKLSVVRNRELTDMTESLILAQNERWRRVLSMQVEREWGTSVFHESGERVSNT